MRKRFVAAAALVVFGIPAAYGASASKETPKPATAAQAQSADDKAAKACRAERASGAEAFAKKYGTNHNLKNAFGKCVSAKSKDDKDEMDEDKDEKSSAAARACKAERASGVEAFAKKYGTNHNLKNAFGKCVSAKSKAKAKN
jgi:hypothetical protein